MAISTIDLHRLYLAYFGRPADISGMGFYTTDAGSTVQSVAAAFSASPESQALYGAGFGEAQVRAIYLGLFGREAEPAGIAYWTEEVRSGRLSPAFAAYGILVGAQNEDIEAVANKMAVSAAFFAAVDTPAEIAGYAGGAAAQAARAYLLGVTADAQTLLQAMAQLEAQVALAVTAMPDTPPPPTGPVSGDRFTIVVDHVTGSAGADVFEAAYGGSGATYNAGDFLDAGDGDDVLLLTLAAPFEGTLPHVTVRNLETVRLVNTGPALQSLDAADFAHTLHFIYAGSGNGIRITGMAVHQAGGVSNPAPGGSRAIFEYAQGVQRATVEMGHAFGAYVEIGGPNVQETLLLDYPAPGPGASNMATLRMTGPSNAHLRLVDPGVLVLNELHAQAPASRITITGASSGGFVVFGALHGDFLAIDASQYQGAVSARLADGFQFNPQFSFLGGAGDDRFYVRNVLAGGSVDAGGGSADELVIETAGAIATADVAARYRGFEVLHVLDGVVQDMGLLRDIGSVRISAGAAVTGVSGLSPVQAINVHVQEAHGGTLRVAPQDTGSLSDTVRLYLDGPCAIGRLEIPATEVLVVSAGHDWSLASLEGAPRLLTMEAYGTGRAQVTTGAIDLTGTPGAVSSIFVLSFAGVTGGVYLDASLAQRNTGTGLVIEGSQSAATEVRDSLQADVVLGGPAADTVHYTRGADQVKLSGGADVFDFNGRAGATTLGTGVSFHIGSAESNTQGGGFDTITGIDNAASLLQDQGCFFRIQTGVAAPGIVRGETLVQAGQPGATAVAAYGFFLLAVGTENLAWLFQDSNGSSFIDADDLAVQLVGNASFLLTQFSVQNDVVTFIS